MNLRSSARIGQHSLSQPDGTRPGQKQMPSRRRESTPSLPRPEAGQEVESTPATRASVTVVSTTTVTGSTESNDNRDAAPSSNDGSPEGTDHLMGPVEDESQYGNITGDVEASEGSAVQGLGDGDDSFTTHSLYSLEISLVSRDRQSECPSAADRDAVTHRRLQHAATPQSRESVTREPNDELASFGLDETSAQKVLELLLTSADSLGLLTILNEMNLDPASLVACFRNRTSASSQCPPELCNLFLAVGIELQPDSLHPQLLENKNIIVDCLRVEFLKQTPTLAWKSPAIKIGHCVGFLLASYVWCLDPQVSGIASRWNDLARILLDDLKSSHVAETKLLQQYVLKRAAGHDIS